MREKPLSGLSLADMAFAIFIFVATRYDARIPVSAMTEPTKIYDFDPRNIPDDYLRAIGLMAMSSAQTESVVGEFIASVLRLDYAEAVALTTHMSAPLKDQICRAVYELNAPSVAAIDELDEILDEIKAASDARNVVVHNSLIRDPDTNEILSYRASARGSIMVSLQPVSVTQIEKDARRIYEAGMALMSYMVTRGLAPRDRSRPIREPLDRKKTAREKRKRTGKLSNPS